MLIAIRDLVEIPAITAGRNNNIEERSLRMELRLKRIISLIMICSSLLTILCGCKEKKNQIEWPVLENPDDRILIADRNNYTNCSQHNLPLFEFYTPDSIVLIRDGTVVAEYGKNDAIYEELLQIHTRSLQSAIQSLKDRFKDELKYPYPHQTKGMVGSPVETESGLRTALLDETYLVYTYADNTYAPVYFEMNDPSVLSQVVSAQPVLEGESGGPYGFHASQELWDYLKNLQEEI